MPCLLTLAFFRLQFLSDLVLQIAVVYCIIDKLCFSWSLAFSSLLMFTDLLLSPLSSLEYSKNYLQALAGTESNPLFVFSFFSPSYKMAKIMRFSMSIVTFLHSLLGKT